MKHRDIQLVKKIIHECDEILKFAAESGKTAFLTNVLYQKAIAMSLLNVGEYANAVSKELWEEYPDIKWRKIVDLRNLVAHGYGELDMELIWSLCEKNIPELLSKMQSVVDHLQKYS